MIMDEAETLARETLREEILSLARHCGTIMGDFMAETLATQETLSSFLPAFTAEVITDGVNRIRRSEAELLESGLPNDLAQIFRIGAIAVALDRMKLACITTGTAGTAN